MVKSDLPFGSEFSPSQIHLPKVLEMAKDNCGDWKAFEADVRLEYFESHSTSDYNRGKLANNTKLGMQAYGIIDKNACLTTLGKKLFDLRHDESRLYLELASHILLRLNGLNLVQCIQDMQHAGEDVNLVKLRKWMDARGIHFPSGGKHPSIMRLWLEKSGIFVDKWRVDEEALTLVLGITNDEIEKLAQLTPEQKAYLKAVSNIDPDVPCSSNDIARLAHATHGVSFDEKGLPKQVLYPLRDAGYIEIERGTKKPGRGAKPFLVIPTEKLKSEVIGPVIEQLEKQVGAELRPLLRKSMSEILGELNSNNRHKKGLALEALAFKLMRILGMDYVATRLRGASTGGAEVDLVFESSRLVFSRWQIQCKNSKTASLDDIAKEVGLTHLLKSNVIVIVTTGKIGSEARKYANKVMAESNLCIVMIDGIDLAEISTKQPHIVNVFGREAKHAMKLKTLEHCRERT